MRHCNSMCYVYAVEFHGMPLVWQISYGIFGGYGNVRPVQVAVNSVRTPGPVPSRCILSSLVVTFVLVYSHVQKRWQLI